MVSNVLIDESVKGKRVINEVGDEIGIVSGVRAGTAYVDPDPGISEEIMTKLGWDDIDEDDYPLREAEVERITDDEVHLRRGL